MCTIKEDQLNAVDGPLWSSTMISPGTDLVYLAYRRPVAASESPYALSSPSIRRVRRQPDLLVLYPNRRRHPTRASVRGCALTGCSLQLNPTKTEVLECSSARRQHQILSSPAYILATRLCHQYHPYETLGLGSISTPTSQWLLTSTLLSEPVLHKW